MLSTISLIGMPGSGKSTVGVMLAKLVGLRFVDTDLDIQVREQNTLQNILEQRGYQFLREVEQEILMRVALEGAVVATGGSAVYSELAMRRLRDSGPVVYLEADLALLERRVAASPPRGIASDPSTTYAQVYEERTPLYRRAADIVVSTSPEGAEEVARGILRQLSND